MAVRDIIQAAGSSAATSAAVYVEDVFSSWLRTGTGASTTITNNIDFYTNGGLVVTKSRSAATSWRFTDKTRGATYSLDSSSASAQATDTNGLSAFTTSGYTIGSDTNYNNSGATYVDFAFRKQAKFFDVVTYTGTGSLRAISHNLGCVPGMIIVKQTSGSDDWKIYHKSLGATKYIGFSTFAAATSSGVWNNTEPTSSVFTVEANGAVNANGSTYVAYLFADSNSGGFGPAGTDSVVACGSYAGTGSSGLNVTLGWEPQFLIIKNYTGSGSSWLLVDNMRGMPVGSDDKFILPNSSGAEFDINWVHPNATGFTIVGSGNDTPINSSGNNYIYLAIRRGPMKTPTDATKVFAPVAYTGSGAGQTVTTGFPVDLTIVKSRSDAGTSNEVWDRLRNSSKYLLTDSTAADGNFTNQYRTDSNTGIKWTAGDGRSNSTGSTFASWNFRRAPGFFDVVCYTGTGSATTVAHNLGVAPELIIVKARNQYDGWYTYHSGIGNTKRVLVNGTNAEATYSGWNNTSPTASVFSVNGTVNEASATYVAYLFATCPGVSKVGSYTGSGTTKQIDCGFASGARFVLIKRTDSTGDWYVWDTARGIVSGNDPYLLLNSTAAENTSTDYIDPYSAGFEISSTAPAEINASGGSFIFLAIA